MTDLLCVTCPVLRPAGQPRQPNHPAVCDGDRERLQTDLLGVTLVGVELHPGRTGAERRASGFESRPPLIVGGLSLTARGSMLPVKEGRPWPQDQLGNPPPLDVLWWWAEDWHTIRAMREQMPAPRLRAVVKWLTDRLDWACDHHPAIDEFAADLRLLTIELRPYTHAETGERVGSCPQRFGDDVCDTPLYVDPYVDEIQCRRCKMTWKRRAGEWMHLRAQQLSAGVETAA